MYALLLSPIRATCPSRPTILDLLARIIFSEDTDNYALHEITSTGSDFRREADENCALLGYYAAYSGIFLQTFRDKVYGPKRL